MYVVTITPKPSAATGSWLAEWGCEGPFDDIAAADLYADVRRRQVGASWHVRVIRVVEPLRSIIRDNAA